MFTSLSRIVQNAVVFQQAKIDSEKLYKRDLRDFCVLGVLMVNSRGEKSADQRQDLGF
jgi:hypothetical protein